MRRDAEKLKFFSFAASLKKRVADDVGKKTLTIYGSRQLGGKKNATSVNLPLGGSDKMKNVEAILLFEPGHPDSNNNRLKLAFFSILAFTVLKRFEM